MNHEQRASDSHDSRPCGNRLKQNQNQLSELASSVSSSATPATWAGRVKIITSPDKSTSMDAQSSSTIGWVKDILSHGGVTGVPVSVQRIYDEQNELADWCTLSACGVHNSDTLFMVKACSENCEPDCVRCTKTWSKLVRVAWKHQPQLS